IPAALGVDDDDPLMLIVSPDTTPPGVPAVTLSSGDSPMPSGSFTRNRSVTVQVAAQEAGGTATVSVNGVATCSNVSVRSTESVSCPLTALADGDYAVSAAHTDAAGNGSAPRPA